MGHIDTFDGALAAIHARSGYDRGFISDPFAGDAAARRGLRRTRAVLDRLGNPERALPIVHVAGSKGKGSTCVFVDAILRAAGRRTGRSLSPHLHSWRERFVVDDRPISERDFVALTREAILAAEAVEAAHPGLGEVTAFELSTAMALRWFRQAACDVGVLEVGLGGTLDATNVVDPAVAAIARLDLEHTAILGSTIAEIAANKAGIIKPGRPAVSAAQPDVALAVIEARAAACDAPLLVAGRDWTTGGTDRDFSVTGPWGTLDRLASGLAGPHQVDNAALAIAALYAAGWRDIGVAAIRDGLRTARLPGRFEIVPLPEGQTVVIDGAHTLVATAALATAVRDRFPDASPVVVAGLLRDKPAAGVLAPLIDLAGGWVAVAPDTPRALPAVAVGAALAELGRPSGTASSVAAGLDDALATRAELVLVTGSLTTAAEARVALGLVGRVPA